MDAGPLRSPLLGLALAAALAALGASGVAAVKASLPLLGRSVTLDPGHGGIDSGARVAGVEEARLNLALARAAASLLAADGAQVVLTRNSSAVRPRLDERPRLADATDGFVSIHVDSAATLARGSQVFVGPHPRPSSVRLGEFLRRRLYAVTHVLRPLNRTSSLAVLRRARGAAVLVEVGFLSHPVERRLLLTRGYRARIARAIYLGVRDYLAGLDASAREGAEMGPAALRWVILASEGEGRR